MCRPFIDFGSHYYCHTVGLDTATAEEATPAPSDEGSPTRKLEEKKGISNPAQPLDAQLGGCPGIDSHEECDDDMCPSGQIRCFSQMWPFKGSYCHKVGIDTAADEATPAPSDSVSPTRKLEEEKGLSVPQQPLDAQSGGCPGIDTHLEDQDEKCPSGQIRCFSWLYPFQSSYCHKIGLDTAADEATPAPSDHVPALHDDPERSLMEGWGGDNCPGLDTPVPGRDLMCADGQIMCMRVLGSTLYCHIF